MATLAILRIVSDDPGRLGGDVVKDSPGRPDETRQPAGEWTDVDDAGSDLTWGVGVVSSRLGITASTLRTWERRYGIGPSHRTHGGHRRYTERDISRVELVRRMVSRGVSAQDAARVARHLDRDDLASTLRGETADHPDIEPADLFDSLLAAATADDTDRVRDLAGGLLDSTPVVEAWRDVLAPTLCRVTHELVRRAVTQPSHGRSVEAVLEALREVRGHSSRRVGVRPQVLMATFSPEAQAPQFVAWTAALVQADVAVRWIGPDVDAREVLDLAEKLSPSVLVLWNAPDEAAGHVRRHVEQHPSSALIRASPSWPDEMRVRFGLEVPEVPTHVGGAVRHVLDRVG